ncbi:hypothetical protein [Planktotalea sp.]|uniref:hypothetical protein n=1 Tax=Planktotalea sp. TaxID=2029877 RepID=UPI003D6BF508
MSKLERIKLIGDVIALPLVAVAAIVGVTGYLTDLREQKRQYTFAVVERYNESALSEARVRLFEVLIETQGRYPSANLGARDLGTVIAQRLTTDPVLATQMLPPLVRIADYFNAARDCMTAQLCAPELLEELLGPDALSFACVFEPSVKLLSARANVAGLMDGANALSKGRCHGN